MLVGLPHASQSTRLAGSGRGRRPTVKIACPGRPKPATPSGPRLLYLLVPDSGTSRSAWRRSTRNRLRPGHRVRTARTGQALRPNLSDQPSRVPAANAKIPIATTRRMVRVNPSLIFPLPPFINPLFRVSLAIRPDNHGSYAAVVWRTFRAILRRGAYSVPCLK